MWCVRSLWHKGIDVKHFFLHRHAPAPPGAQGDYAGSISASRATASAMEATVQVARAVDGSWRPPPVRGRSRPPLPAPPAPITAGGATLGELRSARGTRGIALIRTDRLREAEGATVHAGEVAVVPTKPSWAAF